MRGKPVGRWLSETSAARQASDVAAAKLIALALQDRFDIAAAYAFDDLSKVWNIRDGPARSEPPIRPW
ncbi:hypothetical protein [Streptomyces sp. NPDC001980]|uniref:hypothetical protein n=1 Tax=Streptomyces sp. NPDC001980 TaxID=3157126 RepID=UPI00332E4CB9